MLPSRHHTPALGKGKIWPFLAGSSSRGVSKKEKKKRNGTVRPNVITVSSVTTVPRRRAKFMAREQKGPNRREV